MIGSPKKCQVTQNKMESDLFLSVLSLLAHWSSGCKVSQFFCQKSGSDFVVGFRYRAGVVHFEILHWVFKPDQVVFLYTDSSLVVVEVWFEVSDVDSLI